VVTRLPTSRRIVALTFDGGAGAQGAAAVLRALHAAGVPATFFLTGQFVSANPQLMAVIREDGYLVGNHTATHPHLTRLSSGAVIDELIIGEQRLETALGHDPRPWFRFPYGEYDARTLRLVHNLGYGAVGWTVDTRGWQGRSAGSAEDVVARVTAGLRPGAIVLMHLGANPDDGTTFDADALPSVIAAVRAAGYSFVGLDG
jgi:peptidoglycan/xylan/chitin deacetylase (PgdA/CDA1 family)